METPKKDFLSSLNTQQHQAVTAPLNTQLIVAGAGSGKTRVITARIAYLMTNYGVLPHQIIALTFTNKAGREMQERISSFLPSQALPFVGTFHSYCVRLLRRYSSLLPFKDFTILDTEDARSILRKLLQRYNLEKHTTPAKLHGMISFNKNHLPSQKPDEPAGAPYFRELVAAYEEEKRLAHAYDFDDLLLATLDLFADERFASQHRQNVQHILVDEYQDTNQIQHELLRRMVLDSGGKLGVASLCAVGDQDQSIYSWRGAQADNMNLFTKDFAPVSHISIAQNYRSVQPILATANALISHNTNRLDKELWSQKQATNRVAVLTCQTGTHEAAVVAHTVQLRKHSIPLREMAILYRTHHQSRLLEEALMHAGIPYIIVGGIKFYERQEIKDVLAYLRLLVNPFDRSSLFRIINVPTRGLGEKFEELLTLEWGANPLFSFNDLFAHLLQPHSNLKPQQKERVVSFVGVLKDLSSTMRPSELLHTILERTDYRGYLRRIHGSEEAQIKLENLDELINALILFEATRGTGATLMQFLEDVALMQDEANNREGGDYVSLMTLHAAKGLEFDTVIMTGLEEELLPSARSLHSTKDLEEERRLAYVGITRAKQWLLLTHAQLRSTYGTMHSPLPSRFLAELPSNLVRVLDASLLPPAATVPLLAGWLGVERPAGIRTFAAAPPIHINKPIVRPTTALRVRPSVTQSKSKTSTRSTVAPQQVHPWRVQSVNDKAPRAKEPIEEAVSPKTASPWKRSMLVKHPSFGVGLIEQVTPKGGDEYYLTIAFKIGKKKLLSRFVQQV